MECELCGSSTNLVRAQIEGAIMTTCVSCATFGQKLRQPLTNKPANNFMREEETLKLVNPEYPEKLKRARELKGLKQVEAAKQLSMKESLLHKLETGSATPNLATARKLEKYYGIQLIEAYEEQDASTFAKSAAGEFTLGDVIGTKY